MNEHDTVDRHERTSAVVSGLAIGSGPGPAIGAVRGSAPSSSTFRSGVDGDRCGTRCGCGDTEPAQSDDANGAPAGRRTGRKSAIRAGLVGVACVVGCAAGPLVVGAVAAVAGSLSGDRRVVGGLGLVVLVSSYVAYRRTGRRAC